jgi:Zn-dependent protease
VRIARLFGIDLVLDPSWILSAALLTYYARQQLVLPAVHPPSESMGWLLAFAFAMGITACILAHELSHCLVARAYGLPVRQVRLFVFGGVSLIEREAPSPRTEFAVAIAGPLSSAIIATSAAFAMRLVNPQHRGVVGIWGFYAVINMALAVFNLIPAFPMDGGRVLRSMLWAGQRDRARATRWAALAGRVLAAMMIGAGLVTVFTSSVSSDPNAQPGDGLWFVLIGFYLYGAAGSAGRNEGGERPNMGADRLAATLRHPRARLLDRDDRTDGP